MTVNYKLPWLVLGAFIVGSIPFGRAEEVEGLKVICASRTAKPPVIDGLLDDDCWQQTESRSDFTSLVSGGAAAASRQTSLRSVYDDENLYLGIECQWDDVAILKKGVTEIVAKHGAPPAGICPAKDYMDCFGIELFIDPGATQVNYYQILFNAAGQYTGNYKAMSDAFRGGHTVKSAIRGNHWMAEFVYPCKGLNTGDEWGINVCRNDETYYSIWKQMGPDFHMPRLFGRLVIGNYRQWWEAVWRQGIQSRMGAVAEEVKKLAKTDPQLLLLYEDIQRGTTNLSDMERRTPPDSRKNFETLYLAFRDYHKAWSRLENRIEILQILEKTR